MTRDELERLSRDELTERAKRLGSGNAEVLTKPELVDEILLREAPDPHATDLQRIRGFFGRARDLLADVIEKKLHLPETANLLRSVPVTVPVEIPKPRAVPTVTLAEIYAAQGHKARAIQTLDELLAVEHDHPVALMLRARLEKSDIGSPKIAPESDDDEQPIVIHDAPLPTKYDVNECIAMPVDPATLFVYWEVREESRDFMKATRAGGRIVLRALIIIPGPHGPSVHTRDEEVGATLGDFFLRGLPERSVIRVAIGWLLGETFIPFAHSPPLEAGSTMPDSHLARDFLRWTPHGTYPIDVNDLDAEGIRRAAARLGGVGETGAPIGSSHPGSS